MFNNRLQAINIIECLEFRHLICLLRPSVNETNVFHHTKICELVIDAFHEYFNALKRDLVVSLQLSRALPSILYLLGCPGQSFIHI